MYTLTTHELEWIKLSVNILGTIFLVNEVRKGHLQEFLQKNKEEEIAKHHDTLFNDATRANNISHEIFDKLFTVQTALYHLLYKDKELAKRGIKPEDNAINTNEKLIHALMAQQHLTYEEAEKKIALISSTTGDAEFDSFISTFLKHAEDTVKKDTLSISEHIEKADLLLGANYNDIKKLQQEINKLLKQTGENSYAESILLGAVGPVYDTGIEKSQSRRHGFLLAGFVLLMLGFLIEGFLLLSKQ